MTLEKIREAIGAELIYGENLLNRDVEAAFACDLISEMLLSANSHVLLITSLTNPHVIHTAEVIDALGVIFVGGRKPSAELMSRFQSNGNIPVMSTPLPLFTCCGVLYSLGLKGDQKDPC